MRKLDTCLKSIILPPLELIYEYSLSGVNDMVMACYYGNTKSTMVLTSCHFDAWHV